MFKKALFFLIFLLALNVVFSIRLVDPVYQENLAPNSFVGSIMPGSTIDLIFSKEFGRYHSLRLVSSLPSGFEAKILNETDYAKLSISSPKNAVLGEYPITVELLGANRNDSISVYFLIENGLLDVSLDNYSATTVVGEKAVYNLTFLNNSYADVEFRVVPNVPPYWLSEGFSVGQDSMIVKVNKRSSKTATLNIYPHIQGQKIFNTTVFFDNSSSKRTFSHRLEATTSLKGKLQSSVYGVPFFSFSMLPSFLVNYIFNLFL